MEALRHILVAHIKASCVRLIFVLKLGLRLPGRDVGDASLCLCVFLELEDGVCRRHPRDAQLLLMDPLVAVHDLLAHFADLLLIHSHNLIVTLLVGALERLELLLEDDEVTREFLVFGGQLLVLVRHVCLQLVETVASLDELIVLLAGLDPQLIRHLLRGAFFVLENFEVKVQLLLVQIVDSLHLFHALL